MYLLCPGRRLRHFWETEGENVVRLVRIKYLRIKRFKLLRLEERGCKGAAGLDTPERRKYHK